MKFKFKGLTLNNTYYPLPELVDFCLYELISNKDLPNWKKEVYGFIVEFICPTESIDQLTSGTTGKAKYLSIPKKEMIGSARLSSKCFNLSNKKTALLCLPIKYIAGKMMVVRAFVSGMNLELTNPTGTPDISSFGEIDFCAMVPLQVSTLLNEKVSFEKIKTLIIGGSEIDSSLYKNLQEIKTNVFETFGMTETSSHIALRKINGTDASNYFKPLKHVKLKKDKRACLVIKAPFLKEKVVTNDMVEFAGKNQFKWLGRYDNVINSGGIKVHPESLEKDIEAILQKKVLIISEPDALLGHKIVLLIETGDKNINGALILKNLKPLLPKHVAPKKVIGVSEFPRNKNLKIDRKKILEMIYK